MHKGWELWFLCSSLSFAPNLGYHLGFLFSKNANSFPGCKKDSRFNDSLLWDLSMKVAIEMLFSPVKRQNLSSVLDTKMHYHAAKHLTILTQRSFFFWFALLTKSQITTKFYGQFSLRKTRPTYLQQFWGSSYRSFAVKTQRLVCHCLHNVN